ncbi:MAG TPA: EamA family transporter [Methanocorpusculum sp.]|nr:EamA family transporter [Methanocorpusculum sp.]
MNRPLIFFIAALLIFGTNGIIASFIPLTSYEIVFFRSLLGSLTLLAVFFLLQKRITLFRKRKDLILLILSGAMMGASWMFLYEAYQQTGVGISTLIYYCAPIIVMALAPLLFREKFTAQRVIGFVIVAAGCIILNGGAVIEGIGGFGLFCGAMSAVTCAVMIILNKKATGVGGLENSLFQLIFACMTVAIFVAATSGFSFITTIQPDTWIWILIIGVFNTGIGCFLYFSSIGKLPVQTVSVVGYLEPLSAVIFSAIFLQEILTPLQTVGAICIIGGAIFAEIGWKKLKSRNPDR